MRVVNAVHRVAMFLLLVPVVGIVLYTVLRSLGAQGRNPIVSAARSWHDLFIVDAFRDVFPRQSDLQTAVVALAAYGVGTAQALSYALVLHAMNFVPYIGAGLVLVPRRRRLA